MPRPTRILPSLLLLLSLALPGQVQAQESAAKVGAVLHSANQVLIDLKSILDLTTKTEQKQWENIEGIIETFLFGIDRKKPLGVKVILGGDEERFQFALPLTSLKEFIDENLGGFEITSRRVGTGLYRLSEQKETLGYMRHSKGYVSISEHRAEVAVVADPRRTMADLLAKNYSLAATINNSAKQQAARRKSFAPIRENLLAALKAKKGETEADLALKKTLLSFELGEAERFLVESQSLTAGFRIEPETTQATLDVDLTAIAGSGLEMSIQGLATTPSHFAGVPRAKTAILSGRIHHPLDTFRRTGLQRVLAAARNAIHGDIQGQTEATAAQKAASTVVLDTVVAVIQSAITKGMLDGFIEVQPATGGANVMVAGIRTVEGDRLRAALAAVPDSTVATSVALDSTETAGVTIHEVAVPEDLQADFAVLFGDTQIVLVGTSADAAWCAAGPGALAALKSAIASHSTPTDAQPDPGFVDLSVKVGPWLKVLDNQLGADEGAADRKLALKAFAQGKDTLQLQLRRDGKRVMGRTTLGTGILRFLGKKMAEFSKENFE